MHQVGQVPLKLFDAASDSGRAGDDAHALRNGQAVHGFAQFLAIFALDATRYPAATRVVGHQHQITSGERDEGGECGTLVAALFFLDLDDEFLAFAQRILDARCAYIHTFLEVRAGDFLERKETVTLFAIADEAGFKARLDAGNDPFVDIAFALFATGGFDVEVNELLPINDGNAQFFLVRCIKQHAFHAM